MLERFASYLALERGLVAAAVAGYVHTARPFVESLCREGSLDLEELDGPRVIEFVVARVPSLSPKVAAMTMTVLRSLLGFLHLDGQITQPLAHVVPSVAMPRLAVLPKRLESGQVAALLAACDRGSVVGRRDRAVVMLLARLGVRAGEVAALSLDDIDWRAGEIVVRGKGRAQRHVGEAIASYLQDGRPSSAQGRTVFVRVIAPHRQLTSSRVSTIVADAARRAGLGRVHAHRLRHTLASEILRAGGSLPEVGQVLGHRRTSTTAIYAKVDRERLRQIARPWPGTSR